MADLEIVHRRSFTWAWWVVGGLMVAALLWLGTTFLTADEPPKELAPEAQEEIMGPDAPQGPELRELPSEG